MRHRSVLRLGLLALPLAWAPPAAAQGGGIAPTTEQAARQATVVDGQTVQSDLQAYVLMLQAVQEKLRAAEQAAAREESHSNDGAMTVARQELMHTTREAWRAMQRVPPAIERTEGYRETERELRHALAEIGPTRTLSREEGLEAAARAQRALDRLRLDAAQMSGAAGAPVPATPIAGGSPGR